MKKADPAGSLAQLVRAAIRAELATLHVAFPCKVISFDSEKCRAVVQPVDREAPIQNVRVLGQKVRSSSGYPILQMPILQQGDIVYVVCADEQLVSTGEKSKRSHSKNDAVVVGVFPCGL